MARTDSLGNFLIDVADAIREKKGTSETIQASQFDTEIANLPSGSDLDWSAIGYDSTPQAIIDGYNYAVEIQENWENVTSLSSKFANDKELRIMPLVDTSNATGMNNMFSNCSSLFAVPLLNTSNVTNVNSMFSSCTGIVTIPLFNTSRVTRFTSMFNGCSLLSDESLDNILQMCINATRYTGTKALNTLGINATYYPVSRIEALPHYQDFINAGWTIGY